MLNRFDFELGHLGHNAHRIINFLLQSNSNPTSLMQQDWFYEIIHKKIPLTEQGDPVELVSFMLRGFAFTGINMSWESRLQLGKEIRSDDKSDAMSPLVLQFDGVISLRSLVRTWMNHLGMQKALTSDSTLICIQIDRSIVQGDGRIGKSTAVVGLHGGVDIPFFEDQGLDIFWRDYQVISAVAHQGQDSAGHCRSILKTWPDTSDLQTPCLFLLADDNVQPVRIWHEPAWFAKNVSCIWLCDCTWLDLQQIPAPAA